MDFGESFGGFALEDGEKVGSWKEGKDYSMQDIRCADMGILGYRCLGHTK